MSSPSRSSTSSSASPPNISDDDLSDDGGYMPYDAAIEPLADVEQAAAFEEARREEEEEENLLLSRFSNRLEVREWQVYCEILCLHYI